MQKTKNMNLAKFNGYSCEIIPVYLLTIFSRQSIEPLAAGTYVARCQNLKHSVCIKPLNQSVTLRELIKFPANVSLFIDKLFRISIFSS